MNHLTRVVLCLSASVVLSVAIATGCGSDADVVEAGSSSGSSGDGGGDGNAVGRGDKEAGAPCTSGVECVTGACVAGQCTTAPGLGQDGDDCVANTDCAGGLCASGTCATVPGGEGCPPAGTVCLNANNQPCVDPNETSGCCSRVCAPYGGVALVCMPPSGCKPEGELCRGDGDCCGGALPLTDRGSVRCTKVDGNEFGRCVNSGPTGDQCDAPGRVCKPSETDTCSVRNVCCAPAGQKQSYCSENPANCCARDAYGIPRCLVAPLDCTQPVPADKACATSADCCGKPCVNSKCSATACVPSGGDCTTHADCCFGLPCNLPLGSTKGTCGGGTVDGGTPPPDAAGTCALYGQGCSAAGDCCDGIPCTNGFCVYAVK